MKKSSLAFVVVLLALGAFFAYDAQIGPSFFKQLFSGDKGLVDQISLAFMEDIRFKDFDKAASYHHPEDQTKVDIPKLIERMFKIKPEMLDIAEYDIMETSLDTSGNRARVKLKAKVHILNAKETKNPEIILYYHKKEGKWYMELESSLR